jgi:hypothetical protein
VLFRSPKTPKPHSIKADRLRIYIIFKSKIGKSALLIAQDDYGIIIASLRLAYRSHGQEIPPPLT